MLIIISVNSTFLKKGFRFVKSLFSTDSNDSAQVAPFGDDSCPVSGIKAVKVKTDNANTQVVLGYFNRSNLAQAGEKRFYSIGSGGDISFYIWLKNNNTCEIGGDDDFMVRYSELKAAFDELKGDFNSLITTFNSHVHSAVQPGSGVSGTSTSPGSSSTADISGAKISKIKTYKSEE